jgi:ornithine cyclodeaminase/alanine dehydrogenase-like protein (mu-crystallin family)
MTIFLDERCVADLIRMDDALEAVEDVFRAAGKGEATNVPRVRAPLKDGILRITAGVLSYRGYYGIKISSTTVFGRNAGRIFCLYREATGELCAVVQVFGLGALRTGAASGIATKYMANEDVTTLGVIGSGRQARTQIEAIARVRPIRTVRVFSRDARRRDDFCASVGARLGLAMEGVDAPEDAVAGCGIVVTATTATAPVLHGRFLSPGTHINGIGANYEHRRELDSDAVARASVIATDDCEQVRYESTDLAAPVREGRLHWDAVHGLGDIVAEKIPGRSAPTDITLFKSLGIAIEDVALAARAYERAVERGIGETLPDLAG